MTFRSIRITLVFWFAVILLGSMVGLGVILHHKLRATLYKEADAQLAYWMEQVQTTVGGVASMELVERKLRSALPPLAHFGLLDSDRHVRASSEGLPHIDLPIVDSTITRDHHRWMFVARPDNAGWFLVGRSVRDENHSIRQFLITLLTAGTGVVLLTCIGSYLLVSRALAPTKTISATAQRIAADNLHERIDLERVPSELRSMAATLNESFERIEAAFSAQVAFTADASHELRTPLAVIVAHLELAASKVDQPEDVAERIRICQESTKRIEAIVKGLLKLARADSLSEPLRTEKVALSDLVSQQVQAMRPLADARGVTMEFDPGNVTVSGDPEQLREVISNLMDNAIRYNRPDGTIRVSVACEGGEAVLRVADTGIGLTTEQLPHVFDRFYRADASRARQDDSTGLGLAITQCIVQQHGGSIAVHSPKEGGCEFVVRLPLSQRYS
jgi:heavy metal sensor kinase